MAQLQGSSSQITFVKETTYAVTPTTPQMVQLTGSTYGENLTASSEELVSNRINPNRSVDYTRNGQFTVGGSVPFELGNVGESVVLLCEGLAGTKTGTGTSLDPYIFKRGLTLPSFSVEKGLLDGNDYFVFKGMKVGSLELNMDPGSLLSGSVNFIGKDVIYSATTLDATPTVDNHVPFTGIDVAIEENALPAVIASASISITNGLFDTRVVGSKYTYGVGAGRGETTGTITFIYQDETYFNKILNETETTLKFTCSYQSKQFIIELPKVKFIGDLVPAIASPEGLVQTVNFRGLYDSTAQSDFIIKIINA